MFIRFVPLDGQGAPIDGDSIIVNTDNIVSIRPNRDSQGWEAHGLSLKFTNGEHEWVFVAHRGVSAESLDDRMIALSIALRNNETTNITTPFFNPAADIWQPGDTA